MAKPPHTANTSVTRVLLGKNQASYLDQLFLPAADSFNAESNLF